MKEVRLDIANSNGTNSATYREPYIFSMSSQRKLWDGEPSIGNCASGVLECVLRIDSSDLPKNAQLTPYVKTSGNALYEMSSRFNIQPSFVEIVSGDQYYVQFSDGQYWSWKFPEAPPSTIIIEHVQSANAEIEIVGDTGTIQFTKFSTTVNSIFYEKVALSKGQNGLKWFDGSQFTTTVTRTGGTATDWQQKSQFYVFSREIDHATGALHITAYDAIYRAEQDYYTRSGEQGNWPKTALACMQEIASRTSATICSDSLALLTNTPYYIQYPGYGDGALTMRQVAGDIAKRYAGNWIIDNNGEWRLIRLNDMPPSTHYLITEHGNPITFAGVRILV